MSNPPSETALFLSAAAASVTSSIDADGLAWVIINDATSRANALTPPLLTAIDQAIARLAHQPIKAVILLSGKERIFVAGADLNWLAELPDATTATRVSQHGQAVFNRIALFKVPVVCAIHGAAAGGGFELALACTWRIASTSSATKLGLPETSLGTIPGWGGCVRLPQLIGAQAALDHMLKAQLISAEQAFSNGLVDELVEPSDLRTRARSAALQLYKQGRPIRPGPATFSAEDLEKLAAATAKKSAGQNPALSAAIEVVRQSFAVDATTAFTIEAERFGTITAGPACKNFLHAFSLREQAKKRSLKGWFDEAAPVAIDPEPELKKIGIVGAGVMGAGIAHWCAHQGYAVVLKEIDRTPLDRGLAAIRNLFADSVRRGRNTASESESAYARIVATTKWTELAECDLVIEAIVENMAAKQALFAELARVVRPATLLASNTSALPMEEIFSATPHPERTLGLHFFNPVSRMPLVEIVLGKTTSAATARAALGFTRKLQKTPVICRSSPGFIVTRVLFFYLNEACRLWSQGVPAKHIDQAMTAWGWPMGPLRLIDEVGVDVTDFIYGELSEYFPSRFTKTDPCARLLQAGLKGRKAGTGSGFYTYGEDREHPNPAVDAWTTRTQPVPLPSEAEIQSQLMRVMIDEAERCVKEGVVQSADDIDFALLSGAGFPSFRGGLLHYARQTAR